MISSNTIKGSSLLKFCPNCRAELKFQGAKFCPACGYSLTDEVLEPRIPQEETSEEEKASKISVNELGNRFEEVVEKIFQAYGYKTERRKKMEGKSGTLSEVDIIADKLGKVIAIECKNYAEPIGIEKVRDFAQKLHDLGLGWKGIFISYSGFTDGAAQLAQYENIETWDHDEISEKWLTISVGRLTSHRGQFLILEYALPLTVDFLRATKIDHLNRDKIKVSNVELIYHPYIAIEYHFKAHFKDPTKKIHKFEDRDILYVDALDGHVLNPMPEKGLGILKKAIRSVVSKDARAQNERSKRLVHELQHNKSLREYSLNIENEFTVTNLKPITTPREAVKSCIDFITEKNSMEIHYTPKSKGDTRARFSETRTTKYVPKRENIRIIRKDIVVIPRWSIDFESFGTSYKKEILGCSGTLLEDTLSYCPQHFKIGAITIASKNAIAVCEVCGKSLCEDHIKRCPICNKWLCEEHGLGCSVCQNRFCKDHPSLTCQICTSPVCYACVLSCPICHKQYGRNHAIACDRCGTPVCPNCLVTTGLLRKTRTCKNCANIL
jgi:uncharacterized Zn finger protein (UPF0148 family)